MGVYDPKDGKPNNMGQVIKLVVAIVFVGAFLATMKVACEPTPQPPTPPLM
jgi:hypothetical protein